MEYVALAILILMVSISQVPTFTGLDWRKWTSWLWALYSFLTGLLFGTALRDYRVGLQLGGLMAFLTMFGGITTHWHKTGLVPKMQAKLTETRARNEDRRKRTQTKG